MQFQDRKNWCQLKRDDSFKGNSLIVSEQIGSLDTLPMWSLGKMKRNGMAALEAH